MLRRVAFHRSMAFKLFALIGALVSASVAVNTWQNATLLQTQLLLRMKEKTMQDARQTANGADAVIGAWTSQLVVAAKSVSGLPKERYAEVLKPLVAANPELLRFELVSVERGGRLASLAAADTPHADDARFGGMQAKAALSKAATASRAWLRSRLRAATASHLEIRNLTPSVGLPVVAIALPFEANAPGGRVWAIVVAWQTKLYGALASGAEGSAVLLAGDGRIVSASTLETLKLPRLRQRPLLFDEALTGQGAMGFREWSDAGGRLSLGAYARLEGASLVALTETDGTPAQDAVAYTVRRAVLWGALLVAIAMALSYAAAASTTRNLRALTDATVRIAGGDFKAAVALRSRDEIGVLGVAVNRMGRQLEELLVTKLEVARIESEMQTAKLVQEQFFPQADFEDSALRVTSFFQPATECGGDWWGHFKLIDRYHLICVGDATGHGVPAALVTAMVYSAVSMVARQLQRQAGRMDGAASYILSELNRTLCESGRGTHTMTFFIALLDSRTGQLTFSSAGHNPPFLVRSGAGRPARARRKRREQLSLGGAPLGIDPDAVYGAKTTQLAAGDRIFLFTDGLFECANARGEQWGRRRFLKTLEAAADEPLVDFKRRMLDAAFGHLAGRPPDDDITLVVAELDPDWQPSEAPAPAPTQRPREAG